MSLAPIVRVARTAGRPVGFASTAPCSVAPQSSLLAASARRSAASTRTPFASSSRSYATDAGGEAPRRRFLPRLLTYSTLSAIAFYALSVPASLASEAYADFFADNAPFGEDILDYLDAHHASVARDVRNAEITTYASKAASVASAGFHAVSEAVERVFDSARDISARNEASSPEDRDARKQLAEARATAREKAVKVERKVTKAADTVAADAEGALEKLRGLVDQGKAVVERAQDDIASRGGLVAAAKGAVSDVQAAAASVAQGDDATKEATTTAPKAASPPKGKPYPGELPLQHEPPAGYVAPGERKLAAPTNEYARLRADPGAPSLPKLAPSLSSLSGSEPMVRQLALTIDDLAAFLRDTPVASDARAQGVLRDAQRELDQLGEQLDAIKRAEAARAEQVLADQARRYESELQRAQRDAEAQVGKVSEEFARQRRDEAERSRRAFEEKLRAELATQSEIINERLKEEVVAQGVEMQRRWLRDVKAKVEQERGGRLARLEELATELKGLEKVTLDNAQQLDQGAQVHQLVAALRAARHSALGEAADDGDDGTHSSAAAAAATTARRAVKRSFRDELRVLRNTPRARQDDVIGAALDVLDASSGADEGVESFATLRRWFSDKVRPAVQRAALVPDHAGVASHLASALLSPLLFSKRGLVAGDDVASVVARAEWHLERNQLDEAAREVNQLQGWPKVLAADWLDAARARLEAQQALDVISTQASFASLEVA